MSEKEKNKRRDIRIRMGQPPPPPEVIGRYQNFEGLVTDYQDLTKRLYRKPLYKNPRLFMAVFLIAVIAYLVYQAFEEERKMKLDERARQTLLIQPPLDNLEPGYETYFIDGKKGGSFVHPTGTEVTFPPDAFRLQNGQVWPDKVEIRYRELMNPTDLFLAGTHLVADSAQPTRLEMAAFMDMEALCGNVYCNLRLSSPMTVKLARSQRAPEGDEFQVYRFDTASKYWGGEFRSVENLPAPKPLGEPLESPPRVPARPRLIDPEGCHFSIYVKDGAPIPDRWIDTNWEEAKYGSLNSPCRVKGFNSRLWDDVGIVRIAGTGEYQLTFWRGNKLELEVRAHPVVDEDEFETAMFEYREALRAYLELPPEENPRGALREYGGFALRLATLGRWTVARPAPERDERMVPVKLVSDRCQDCELPNGMVMIRRGENSIERYFPDEDGLFLLPQGDDGTKLLIGREKEGYLLFMHPSYFGQLSEWDGESTVTVRVKTLTPAWRFPEEVHRVLRLR